MPAATTYSPAALQIFDLFRVLPETEKENVRARLIGNEPDADDLPAWQLEVLQHREKLREQGADEPIPWEDAKRELRKKWAASS